MYFIDKEVASVERLGAEAGRVRLHFVGDSHVEEVSEAEWENGKSEKPCILPIERQEAFVKRTTEMRKNVARVFFGDNPRYWEVPKILIWVQEGIKDAYEKAVASAFKVKNFESDVNIELVVEKAIASKPDILASLTPAEKDIVSVLRKNDVKVWQIRHNTYFSNVIEKLKECIDESVVNALGVDNNVMRTDDIEEFLKKYDTSSDTTGAEQTPEVTTGSESKDEGGTEKEDQVGEQKD